MCEFRSEEELVEAIKSENNIRAGFVLGIDGKDGTGKTTLAKHLAESIGASVISLDEFIEKNKDAYVSVLRVPHLKRAIAEVSGPVIIEGVCLLDALKRMAIPLSRLVYVKRISSYGVWCDEEVCDPPEDVEAYLAKQREDNRLFAELEAHLEGSEGAATEDAQLTGLRTELIRYHAKYRPVHQADYVFERDRA
jgi:hypothetical protein